MTKEIQGFVLAIILVLPLLITLWRRCISLKWQLRLKQCEGDAGKVSERFADQWQSKYSTAERERIHLKMEVDRLRDLLMTKQGAGEN